MVNLSSKSLNNSECLSFKNAIFRSSDHKISVVGTKGKDVGVGSDVLVGVDSDVEGEA